jgi:deazaflavin-dependent oxidoreductase (nitroreductase family)
MDEKVRHAILSGLTCDITTYGRKSGQPRRMEIWYFVVDGTVYLTGTPGPRDWLANLVASPQMVFHVKQGARADLPARGTPIVEPEDRRRVMGEVLRQNSWFAAQPFDLETWVADSPLVAVVFPHEAPEH